MLDVADLATLRRTHPAWRLLSADHAPLVLALLDEAFTSSGRRVIEEVTLVDLLDGLLARARADDPDALPRPARDYLQDWCGDAGWLRRYYLPDSDEPVYDLTSAAEKALTWVSGLTATRSFVGTESRLLAVVALLDQIVEGSEADPAERVRVLQERRDAIDAQIAQIESGVVPTLEPGQIRDRYQALAATARGLLADFREVEDNFRALDRATREQIATWDGPRGELLGEVLGRTDAITGSDTGSSFRAFYDFLLSPSTRERFTRNLAAVAALPDLTGADDDVQQVVRDWAVAAEAVQRTVARLSAQLRRFLEDEAYADNRRVAGLIRACEAAAIEVRDDPPAGEFVTIDVPRADWHLPMDRVLYRAPVTGAFAAPAEEPVFTDDDLAAVADLFAQQRVDPQRVRDRLAATLREYGAPLTVGEALTLAPLTDGLTELVTVLEVADAEAWLDGADLASPAAEETVEFTDPDTGRAVVARLPRLMLTDPHAGEDLDHGW